MKVMTILGTRPEIIRLSRVMAKLDEYVDHVVVHTGQNYDYALNEVFFEDLGVRRPDYFLEVDTSSLGAVLGGVLSKSEPVMREERPDAVLVLGDTNSSLAAIMAKRLGIPVFHMEAGNRCFDPNVPEETNRKIIDHVADINLVYTEHARRNLLAEGIHPRMIYLTGSPLREVLTYYRPQIESSSILTGLGLEEGQYYLVSAHREENVDDPERLAGLVQALSMLSDRTKLPVIVSTHPRTRQRLTPADTASKGRIRFLPPFGFHDYNLLQLRARCVLSDSGSISEEAAILDFPAITMRDSIERPEAMDTGVISVAGTDATTIVDATLRAETMFMSRLPGSTPADYQIENTSDRVVALLTGVAPLIPNWTGRRSRP